MKPSKRTQAFTSSLLQEFFKKVKKIQSEGKNVISLGVGEPYYDTPGEIKKAGIEAIENNKTKYLSASGSLGLKEKLASIYHTDTAHILVTSGAKSALGIAMQCVVDPGDTVLVPSPYYPPFVEMTKFLGGIPVLIETKNNGFKLTADQIERTIKEQGLKPKILLVNSPNNPTGMVYDREELAKITELSKRYGFTVFSDECYRNFSPDKKFTYRDLDPNSFVFDSVSKTYAMTGWRVGWVVCPDDWTAEDCKKIEMYLENFVGCPSSISDYATIVALDGDGVERLDVQRKIVTEWLDKMGIPFSYPDGAFYVFPDFRKYIKDDINGSEDLAEYILNNAGVAMTPGISFGEYDSHLRISFSVKENILIEALEKVEKALDYL